MVTVHEVGPAPADVDKDAQANWQYQAIETSREEQQCGGSRSHQGKDQQRQGDEHGGGAVATLLSDVRLEHGDKRNGGVSGADHAGDTGGPEDEAEDAQAELAGRCLERLRWEEHTSELPSLMRLSYSVFRLIINNKINS